MPAGALQGRRVSLIEKGEQVGPDPQSAAIPRLLFQIVRTRRGVCYEFADRRKWDLPGPKSRLIVYCVCRVSIGLRKANKQLQHVVDEPAEGAVSGLSDQRGMRSNSHERGSVSILDRSDDRFMSASIGTVHRGVGQRCAARPAASNWLQIRGIEAERIALAASGAAELQWDAVNAATNYGSKAPFPAHMDHVLTRDA